LERKIIIIQIELVLYCLISIGRWGFHKNRLEKGGVVVTSWSPRCYHDKSCFCSYVFAPRNENDQPCCPRQRLFF
jgi:hypothetical protein